MPKFKAGDTVIFNRDYNHWCYKGDIMSILGFKDNYTKYIVDGSAIGFKGTWMPDVREIDAHCNLATKAEIILFKRGKVK
jgi:hypothetical protein